MSRRAKGPRLWLRPARRSGSGALTHIATWFILDGAKQHGTGCGETDRGGAESALADYIRRKHTSGVALVGSRDPSRIPIADVINLYLQDVAPNRARPGETINRLLRVLDFFGDRSLDHVTGATCRAYARQRSTQAAARRELEDLRSAISHHRGEGLHDKIVSVVLPERAASRERWLTRHEAARLIWAAWRYREDQGGPMSGRLTRRHVARFMLVARYMGSRASVICGASIERNRPADRPWVDLTTGIFYGRPEGQRETKKRRQRVRVPGPLLAHLRRWRRKGQRYAVEWNGEPVERVTKAHAAVVAAAGLGREVTPHIWRHTAVTWTLQGGAPVWQVAKFFGLTTETVERVYGHHCLDDSVEIHDAFAAQRRQRTAKDKSEQKAIPTLRIVPKSPAKSA